MIENYKNENLSDSNPSEKPKGRLLKEIREERKLSLATVHEATKIPLDVLRAIEEGYSVRTLSPFYLRGFLKIYANYLGIELSRIIDEKPITYNKIKSAPADEMSFDFLEEFSKFMTKERKKQFTIGIAIIISLFLLSKFIGFLKSRPQTPKVKAEKVQTPSGKTKQTQPKEKTSTAKATEAKSSSQQKSQAVVAIPTPKPSVVNEAKAPQPTPTAPPVAASAVLLTVKAKDKSWLRVVADEEVVFQGTLRSGAVESWKAKDKIVISGRNINQLEFELNGKVIGTLGRKDRQAREIIVTKDGLSVTK